MPTPRTWDNSYIFSQPGFNSDTSLNRPAYGNANGQDALYRTPKQQLIMAQTAALYNQNVNENRKLDIEELNNIAQRKLQELGINTNASVAREGITAENQRNAATVGATTRGQDIAATTAANAQAAETARNAATVAATTRGQDIAAAGHKDAVEAERMGHFISFIRDHPDIPTDAAANALAQGGATALAGVLQTAHAQKIEASIPPLLDAYNKSKIDKNDPNAVATFIAGASGGDVDKANALRARIAAGATGTSAAPTSLPVGSTPGYDPNVISSTLSKPLATGASLYNTAVPVENFLRSLAGASPRQTIPTDPKVYKKYLQSIGIQ
jgi:hypothetical protein